MSHFSAVLPAGTIPYFNDTKQEADFLEEAVNFVLSLDCGEENELITDMCTFNVRGNRDVSKFSMFWDYCATTLDLANGSGAHYRRHVAGDEETTHNVSYAPGILFIPQLVRATVEALEKEDKVKGKDIHIYAILSQQRVRPHGRFVQRHIALHSKDSASPSTQWQASFCTLGLWDKEILARPYLPSSLTIRAVSGMFILSFLFNSTIYT